MRSERAEPCFAGRGRARPHVIPSALGSSRLSGSIG